MINSHGLLNTIPAVHRVLQLFSLVSCNFYTFFHNRFSPSEPRALDAGVDDVSMNDLKC